ncbi:hypothetical protein [Roseateles sp. LYH14W]|uniref:Uncharacterized protein n=1 Tax=Pelomonas parva TaxID=3299032 RepID=A0ABW7EVT8_9BURK
MAAATSQATTPGPTKIIQCPGSDEIRSVPSINSGNTFGARIWTDGYMVAPMLPRFPAVTRCSDSGPIFWVASAKVLGEITPWGELPASAPQGWKQAPTVRSLKGAEYLQAIADGLGDTAERLAYLRRHAWWEANHQRRPREASQAAIESSDFAAGSADRDNLEALLASLDESNVNQLLTKVEGLRQLARFDEAAVLLERAAPAEARLQPWVKVVGERIRLRDARVVMLPTK